VPKKPPNAERPETEAIEMALHVHVDNLPALEITPAFSLCEAPLINEALRVRSLGSLSLLVRTEGWRFPVPPVEPSNTAPRPLQEKRIEPRNCSARTSAAGSPAAKARVTRLRPPSDSVVFKDRLLYLLQPPLESLFAGRQVQVPCPPYPYQLEGIAFLMPRHAALLADEMGLGKTMQAILSLRLLFQSGLIRNALVVCPKSIVATWSGELRAWAADLPFEVIGGDSPSRRASWQVSNCPLKLVNYELLTRDAALFMEKPIRFDVVVLDEAQRIKNRDAKAAQAVRSLQRDRSWALTGTPIENRPDDLISLFAFVDPNRIPPDTPAKRLPQLTADCILRRTKDDVLTDLPPKTVRDAFVELTPAQREAYDLAETNGIVRLNALGDTISVQHVFELVMRLKQICNFDPLTRQSAKLERLETDLAEVADSGRKAIVFSQWVEPLIWLSTALAHLGPLQYHGKIPPRDRQAILDRFQRDRRKHVLLMSYGTGSVGLNLQFTNYVFLFDRWWNPAVEDQAINRAHRIGQREPVFVTRFITPDTIEARIAQVLDRKRRLFSELIEQNDPPPQLGLTEEEIFSLFDIQSRPKRAAA
jgi:SNF2 family DNA or RNA helicase